MVKACRSNKQDHALLQVVPDSGPGWQLALVTAGTDGAEIRTREPLDFSSPAHRAGLHFRVQVTDQVRTDLYFNV